LLGLARAGRISEERIDVSARRILRDKFRLGRFDDPFVDPDEAERIVGSERFRPAGERVQRRSLVLIENRGLVALRGGRELYVQPTGKLPFELPSSMDAVRARLPDVPHDSDAPLYPYGHGLASF